MRVRNNLVGILNANVFPQKTFLDFNGPKNLLILHRRVPFYFCMYLCTFSGKNNLFVGAENCLIVNWFQLVLWRGNCWIFPVVTVYTVVMPFVVFCNKFRGNNRYTNGCYGNWFIFIFNWLFKGQRPLLKKKKIILYRNSNENNFIE